MGIQTEYTCDICGHKTMDEKQVHNAKVTVSGTTGHFHVCVTCWTESPKGVFQRAFNRLLQALRMAK